MRSAVAAHSRLVLAAARDARKNTPRYQLTIILSPVDTTSCMLPNVNVDFYSLSCMQCTKHCGTSVRPSVRLSITRWYGI